MYRYKFETDSEIDSSCICNMQLKIVNRCISNKKNSNLGSCKPSV